MASANMHTTNNSNFFNHHEINLDMESHPSLEFNSCRSSWALGCNAFVCSEVLFSY